jgi:polyribonucleotide nucleotidyltransferase
MSTLLNPNPVKSKPLFKNTPLVTLTQFDIFNSLLLDNRNKIESCLYNELSKDEKNQQLKDFISQLIQEISSKQKSFYKLQKQYRKLQSSKDIQEVSPESKESILKQLSDDFPLNYRQIFALNYNLSQLTQAINRALDDCLTIIIKDNLIHNKRRVDGRRLDQTRAISCQVDVLSQPHASSLFQRGETQVLNVLTLGSGDAYQGLDGIEDLFTDKKRYMHHYNFPSYSVGEIGRYIGAGRREIGHGALAEKALTPVLPTEEEFPYVIRLVSECLGSNGSTSMASTCASTLSLLAGGVPIKDMVGGVAMGLALDEKDGQYVVLTDIQGLEDHHADMDFKVTGTNDGITAIQLDNKIGGMTAQVLIQALEQAKNGRIFILDKMREVIDKPRNEISSKAPRVKMVLVPMDKIRDVIGSGGSIINGMETDFGVEISLENETGRCSIYGKNSEMVEKCYKKILSIIKVYEIDEVITGTVFRIEKYGAFISFDDSDKSSMLHISNMGNGSRINQVEDVLKVGNRVQCRIKSINDKGQFDLILQKIL